MICKVYSIILMENFFTEPLVRIQSPARSVEHETLNLRVVGLSPSKFEFERHQNTFCICDPRVNHKDLLVLLRFKLDRDDVCDKV